MKNLTKLLFCIFAYTVILSCEPEEIRDSEGGREKIQVIPYSDTGDQGEIFDDKKN